jgi:hypothetical protein
VISVTKKIVHPAEAMKAEALAIHELRASVVEATDIGTYAVEYALANWSVFPLNGKVPAIRGGRGVLDATTDVSAVIAWWSGAYARCNIGGRVLASMFVLDIDPRHGGLDSLAKLEREHGPLPETLQTLSGRRDGGGHHFYRRPPGRLSAARLGPGIDIKTSTGYVVLPPSIHPDTGKPYTLIEHPVAAPPAWLVQLMQPEQPKIPLRKTMRPKRFLGSSIADEFSANTSWADILEPHGWCCLDPDPGADGTRWRHPTATAEWSATIRNNCLFVYSTNTPFEVTESGNPKGYTQFRAYAVLEHNGNLKAAARAIRKGAA